MNLQIIWAIDDHDVLSFRIGIMHNGEEVAYVEESPHAQYGVYEISYDKPFDSVELLALEHLYKYSLIISREDFLNSRFAVICIAEYNPNDTLTYAGCFSYTHPIIKFVSSGYRDRSQYKIPIKHLKLKE